MQERSDVSYGHASMLLLGEGSEATEPCNKYDKIRPHSIRSLQFDQKVRPLSSRPKKFDLFTATQLSSTTIHIILAPLILTRLPLITLVFFVGLCNFRYKVLILLPYFRFVDLIDILRRIPV